MEGRTPGLHHREAGREALKLQVYRGCLSSQTTLKDPLRGPPAPPSPAGSSPHPNGLSNPAPSFPLSTGTEGHPGGSAQVEHLKSL